MNYAKHLRYYVKEQAQFTGTGRSIKKAFAHHLCLRLMRCILKIKLGPLLAVNLKYKSPPTDSSQACKLLQKQAPWQIPPHNVPCGDDIHLALAHPDLTEPPFR